MDSSLLFAKVPAEFLFGGGSTFTVLNGNRDKSYTFQIDHAESKPRQDGGMWPEKWFCKLLTGSDNTSDYTLFGWVDRRTGKITLTQKTKFTRETEPVRVLEFVTTWAIQGKEMPGGIVVQAPTHCGKCGRLLTAPRERNPYWPWLGPECGKKI